MTRTREFALVVSPPWVVMPDEKSIPRIIGRPSNRRQYGRRLFAAVRSGPEARAASERRSEHPSTRALASLLVY